MKRNKYNQAQEKQKPSTSSSTNYSVIPTEIFVSEAKRLKKKYPHIRDDFYTLQQRLRHSPFDGNQSLGRNLYKVRMNISDKNTGESGGARIIIEIQIIEKKVYVLSVYDKSEISDLTEQQIDKIVNQRIAQFP